LVNINAYHQPGVEAGKVAAAVILDLQTKIVSVLQSEKSKLTIAQIAEKAGATDKIESIYIILRHLHANNRGIVLEGNLSEPGNLTVSIA
jgi:glucose-6-phosphate isomerase